MRRNLMGSPWSLWSAVLVFALALTLRLIYLRQISDIGFFRHPVSDGLVYDQRARAIAAGDWLGPADFVHAPLYAYFLGLIHLMGGSGPWAPRIVQAILSAAGCVVLMLAGRRFFDPATGLIAGLLLAVYPPVIFFDGLIQKTSLALFLDVLLLWFVAGGLGEHWRSRCGAAGVVLGLLILTRQNAMTLAPLLIAWLWIEGQSRHASGAPVPRRRLAGIVVFAAALAATLAPWAIRNRVVTGELVLTTPNLGQNFAMGNHPEATGTYLPFKRGRSSGEHEQEEWVKAAEKVAGRHLSAREVSDYYFHAGLAYIKANPLAWLRLTAKKCLMMWNAYEAPDTEDYYLYQEASPLLRGLDRAFHFGVLCPAAMAGVVLTRGRFRRLWFLYAWLVLTTISVAVFVVFARYRCPVAPVLVMLASSAVVETVGTASSGRSRRLLAPLCIVVLSAGLSNWPVYLERRPYSPSYVNHAVALADQYRDEEALLQLKKAFALAPDDVDAHLVQGSVLLDLGDYEQALVHYQTARQGDPQYNGAYRGIGDALLGRRRYAEASDHYQQALQLEPADHLAMNGLAAAMARQGHYVRAFELLNRALALAPDCSEAYLNLGNTYLATGRADEAARAYQQALHFRPGYADALYNLGVIEASRGRLDRAVELFEDVLSKRPDHREAREALDAAMQMKQRQGATQPQGAVRPQSGR
jgi:tetratricopeptide (TPR) repeat protein